MAAHRHDKESSRRLTVPSSQPRVEPPRSRTSRCWATAVVTAEVSTAVSRRAAAARTSGCSQVSPRNQSSQVGSRYGGADHQAAGTRPSVRVGAGPILTAVRVVVIGSAPNRVRQRASTVNGSAMAFGLVAAATQAPARGSSHGSSPDVQSNPPVPEDDGGEGAGRPARRGARARGDGVAG